MFEKPVLKLVKFQLEDILTASGNTNPDEPIETDPVAPTVNPCPTETSEHF